LPEKHCRGWDCEERLGEARESLGVSDEAAALQDPGEGALQDPRKRMGRMVTKAFVPGLRQRISRATWVLPLAQETGSPP